MKKGLFVNKIKALENEEVEYSEDFFARAFGKSKKKQEATVLETLQEGVAQSQQKILSHSFSDKDIDENWLEQEQAYDGQLAVDVIETENEIVITSTIAGVASQDLDLQMNGDMITIKGIRKNRFAHIQDDEYIIRECFWGGFSRSIILPSDIQHDGIKATLENGVLSIILPKSKRSRNARIDVMEVPSSQNSGDFFSRS